MRLPKFLWVITLITFSCLLYVYQQAEIFRLAYVGQKNSAVFQDLLDKNTILRYNINKNTSLTLIDNKISEYANFEMPASYRLVRLAYPQKDLRLASQPNSPRRENIFARLFGIKRQAEAKTINP